MITRKIKFNLYKEKSYSPSLGFHYSGQKKRVLFSNSIPKITLATVLLLQAQTKPNPVLSLFRANTRKLLVLELQDVSYSSLKSIIGIGFPYPCPCTFLILFLLPTLTQAALNREHHCTEEI